MSQPKHKRRKARRRRQAERANAKKRAVYIHLNVTGEARNPLGRVSSLDRAICVGFGSAVVLRDGAVFENGDAPKRRGLVTSEGVVTLRKVEKWIKKHGAGRSRWTASVHAPLWSAEWERQRPGKWVCIAAGEGFA